MNKKMHNKGPSKQLGVTLVELLIAMVIGAFLVGGILQVFPELD